MLQYSNLIPFLNCVIVKHDSSDCVLPMGKRHVDLHTASLVSLLFYCSFIKTLLGLEIVIVQFNCDDEFPEAITEASHIRNALCTL